jgi:hypothetical protein
MLPVRNAQRSAYPCVQNLQGGVSTHSRWLLIRVCCWLIARFAYSQVNSI